MDKPRLLIFDLDGTLVDTSRDLTKAINLTFSEFNLAPVSVDHVTKHIGFGVLRLLKEINDSSLAFEIFQRHYMNHLSEHSCVYPGIKQLLESTTRYEKVILTNKMQVFLEPLLRALEIREFFSGVYGLEAFTTSKPDPGPILEISRLHGMKLNQMFLIGDTEADVRAGKLAGVDTCAVEWGYGERNVLKSLSPSLWASHPFDLIKYLEN